MGSHEIRIDPTVPVRTQADRCHNRWHPDIPPVLTIAPGDEVVVHTRDAVDGQFSMDSTHEDVLRCDRSVVHPLTGPIRVEGAAPGDVLTVELLEIVPAAFGYTAEIPGFGFLADEFPEPFLVRWDLADGGAISPDLPGVRIPASPFVGTMGVAPSHELLEEISRRESAMRERGDDVALPDARGAVPETEPIASTGLRTKPPRENGGNMDVRQMVAGTTILFPVWRDGALFSVGDAHFAQGDGESCGTAIEMRSVVRVRLDLRPGEATQLALRDVRFEIPAAAADAGSRRSYATTGLSGYASTGGPADDLTAAAKHALRNMLAHLEQAYGFTRQEAYALASVAVDLRIGQVVDSPNHLATAVLPTDIFTSERAP